MIDYEFSYSDAKYLHHFASELGRWLDCTDPQRQFTLKIPQLVRRERILLLAVTCFAARHMRDTSTAVLAHEESVNLLISRLNVANVASDDALLCAIVILRVYEQLDGKFETLVTTMQTDRLIVVSHAGIDHERHLTGFSALLRSSQGLRVDPAVPTLRHAAFWVYVRQAMYNACVYQQPPDVDPDIDVRPVDMTQGASSFVQKLEQQAAWTNYVVWLTIKVMHFCFRSGRQEIHEQLSEWEKLGADLDQWQSRRPSSFEPIWVSQADSEAGSPFPVVLLMTDWHGKIDSSHPLCICCVTCDSNGIRLLQSLSYIIDSISTKTKIRNETARLTGREGCTRNPEAHFAYVWRMPEHVGGSTVFDYIMSDMLHLYATESPCVNM